MFREGQIIYEMFDHKLGESNTERESIQILAVC